MFEMQNVYIRNELKHNGNIFAHMKYRIIEK